jgi:hypothetical protein
MKSKIKFNTQNFKNKFKIFVLVFIILSSVYFLYFNDRIFVQAIIQNSLNNEDNTNSNIIENFDVSRYEDICKNRKTRFYDFNKGTSSGLNIAIIDASNNCESICDNNPNCQFFIMKDNSIADVSKCFLYNRVLDSSNIDRSTMNIKVNCNSVILPSSTNTYNGYGYINKKYFEYNKAKFSYIDTYLDKANELVSTIKSSRSNINDIINQNGVHSQLVANAQNYTGAIGSWITSFGNLIGVSSENLTTLNTLTNLFRDNISDDEKNKKLKDLVGLTKETPELDNKLVDVKNSGYVDSLFYTILAFIMIITIILLVLYRLNDNIIISDRFMIFYFIIIVILFMFIRFILNK